MPRFSDIFVWESTTEPSKGIVIFNNCRLIKRVGQFEAGLQIDKIVFDILGMCLFFRDTVHCLTVH